jgi:hypothetical protein
MLDIKLPIETWIHNPSLIHRIEIGQYTNPKTVYPVHLRHDLELMSQRDLEVYSSYQFLRWLVIPVVIHEPIRPTTEIRRFNDPTDSD